MVLYLELIFGTNEGLVKYFKRNQNGRMAETLMACYQRFYIWSSVSRRRFEIFNLLFDSKVLYIEGLVHSKYIIRKNVKMAEG